MILLLLLLLKSCAIVFVHLFQTNLLLLFVSRKKKFRWIFTKTSLSEHLYNWLCACFVYCILYILILKLAIVCGRLVNCLGNAYRKATRKLHVTHKLLSATTAWACAKWIVARCACKFEVRVQSRLAHFLCFALCAWFARCVVLFDGALFFTRAFCLVRAQRILCICFSCTSKGKNFVAKIV